MKNSHYDILGVRESADRRSIRAAYLKKIKASHPDRARRGKSSAERAAAINLAYFVLRDPRRRLAYDLDLKRTRNGVGAAGPVGLWRAPSLSGASKPPPPPRSRKAVASGILLGAAILGLILLIVDLESAAPLPPRLSVAAAPDSAIPAEPEASPWVDREMVDRAVDTLMMIRARGRSSDALAYSRNCFVRLEEAPSALLLDHCLAFDVAAANWRRDSDAPAEADFAPQAMRPRHTAAFRRVAIASDERERMREVNLATFAALARRLRPAEEENQLGLAANYADVAEDVASTR